MKLFRFIPVVAMWHRESGLTSEMSGLARLYAAEGAKVAVADINAVMGVDFVMKDGVIAREPAR